jgi:hypothetical protein
LDFKYTEKANTTITKTDEEEINEVEEALTNDSVEKTIDEELMSEQKKMLEEFEVNDERRD